MAGTASAAREVLRYFGETHAESGPPDSQTAWTRKSDLGYQVGVHQGFLLQLQPGHEVPENVP